MAYNGKQIEQQVKNKMKSYNRQRAGLVIVIAVFIAIFVFSPMDGLDSFPDRLSIFCSAVLLLCCAAFVPSFRVSLLLHLAATGVPGVLLGLNQIRSDLFLILFLINSGTILTSSITANAIIRSFTRENREINRLEKEATTDNLTQLLNRNGLEQAVGTAWAFCKRDKKNVGVILADIDYFKSYNDTMGHLEGDNILKQVADSIKDCFRRDTDIISRIGGDEFLIFLSDIDDNHILEMARTLSSSIINLKVKTSIENSPCSFLSVSIGIAGGVPQPDDLLIDLYKNADEALYRAKKVGRNCIFFHEKIIQIGAFMGDAFPVDVSVTRNNKDKKNLANRNTQVQSFNDSYTF